MTKFKTNDKVIRKGTTSPVMTVLGNAMTPALPSYTPDTDRFVVEWADLSGKHRATLHGDDLELFPSS